MELNGSESVGLTHDHLDCRIIAHKETRTVGEISGLHSIKGVVSGGRGDVSE